MTSEPLIIDGMDCTRHLVAPGGPKMAPGHRCLRPGCPTIFYGKKVWNYCYSCNLRVSPADRQADRADPRWMTLGDWQKRSAAIMAAVRQAQREGRC
jgi:hypothetical protein